ncbi:MAG: chemotaxis protein CheW [Steroidobacteraceae bacterium]|jgi:purine-binding chemotaxis protein CheW
MTETEKDDRFLLCRIGSRIGALTLKDVREVMRPLPIEPLAGTPPFVLGLAIVRGFPTPVIDAGRLLGPIDLPSPARFVSLRLGERSAALAVDAVLDVRSLAAGDLKEIPPLLREAGADLVSAIGALDTELLLVLEAARLVPESIWSAIEASGAST